MLPFFITFDWINFQKLLFFKHLTRLVEAFNWNRIGLYNRRVKENGRKLECWPKPTSTQILAAAAGKSRVDLRLLGFMGPLTPGAPWTSSSFTEPYVMCHSARPTGKLGRFPSFSSYLRGYMGFFPLRKYMFWYQYTYNVN